MQKTIALAAVCACILATQLTSARDSRTERRYFQLPEMAELGLPFSDAVLAGNTLYLSGAGGIDLETMQPPQDPKAEAGLLMTHLQRTLALADMTLDDLVSVTVYSPDLTLYSDFNEVYRQNFDSNFPARAFIGSSPLLFGMRFEVQAIAVK